MTIEASLAPAVAWVWRCPECHERVTIFAAKGNLEPQHPCEHFILARLSHQGMSVQFARDVAEQEAGPMRMQRE